MFFLSFLLPEASVASSGCLLVLHASHFMMGFYCKSLFFARKKGVPCILSLPSSSSSHLSLFSEIVHKKKWSTDEKASGLFFPCLLLALLFLGDKTSGKNNFYCNFFSLLFLSLSLFPSASTIIIIIQCCCHCFSRFEEKKREDLSFLFSLLLSEERQRRFKRRRAKILVWKQLLVFHNLISLLLCLSWFFNSFLANLLFLCLQSFLPVSLFVTNFGWRNFPIERMITKDSSNFSVRLLLIFESKFLSFLSSSCAPDFCF